MGLGNKKAGAVDVLPTKAPVERLPPRHESEAKRNGVNPLRRAKKRLRIGNSSESFQLNPPTSE